MYTRLRPAARDDGHKGRFGGTGQLSAEKMGETLRERRSSTTKSMRWSLVLQSCKEGFKAVSKGNLDLPGLRYTHSVESLLLEAKSRVEYLFQTDFCVSHWRCPEVEVPIPNAVEFDARFASLL